MSKLNRSYVSELDQFLTNFDKRSDALTDSRQNEACKHQEIAHKRDNPNYKLKKKTLWEKF